MKNKSKIIMSVIITFILTLSITVTAALVTSANNITFTPSNNNWDVNNTNEALNSLYTLTNVGTATNSDIRMGKTALVNGQLITGTMTSNQEKIMDWKYAGSTGNTISVTEGKTYVIMMDSYHEDNVPTITGAEVLKGPFFECGGNFNLGLAIVKATSNSIKFGNREDGASVIGYFELDDIINMNGELSNNIGIVTNKAIPTTIGKVYLVVCSEAHAAGDYATLVNGTFYNSNQNMYVYDSYTGINFAIIKATSDTLIYRARTEDLSQGLSYMGYVELF